MARMRPPVWLVRLPIPCSLDDNKELDLQYSPCLTSIIESLFSVKVKKKSPRRLSILLSSATIRTFKLEKNNVAGAGIERTDDTTSLTNRTGTQMVRYSNQTQS